jgi:hypothetical protein
MFKPTLFAALAAMTLSVAAHAGDQTPRLDQRQENQQQRIANGVESGTLNAATRRMRSPMGASPAVSAPCSIARPTR